MWGKIVTTIITVAGTFIVKEFAKKTGEKIDEKYEKYKQNKEKTNKK